MAPSKRIAVDDITPNNLGTFKKLHQVIFPVPYSDQFFKESLAIGELAKLAYFNDISVGALRLTHDKSTPTILYISTLGVLPPYRSLSIGTAMLTHTMTQAKELGCEVVEAHVSTENEMGVEWWKKRGFEVVEVLEGYYEKKEDGDRDAWLVRRRVE